MKVTVVNDDLTVLVSGCDVINKLSNREDMEITHLTVFWYDDVFNEETGHRHVVPIERCFYECGKYEETKTFPIKIATIETIRITIPEELRNEIYDRDGRKCVQCGATDNLCIDHVYPFVNGGKTERDNLQTLCRSCNSKKKDRISHE